MPCERDEIFRIFPTVEEAKVYRSQNGAGGWIFVSGTDSPNEKPSVVLFPYWYTPTKCMTVPIVRGLSGVLV